LKQRGFEIRNKKLGTIDGALTNFQTLDELGSGEWVINGTIVPCTDLQIREMCNYSLTLMGALSVKAQKSGETETIQVAATGQTGNIAPPDEAVGVDKIRDLLFGSQMQDYDRRFAMLEQRFLQRFREIDAESARNLNSLELSAKKQMESLATQLGEEKDLRTDADKEIERTHREHSETNERRLRSISEQLSRLERDQADRLTQEVQSLRDEIKRKHEELQHTIERMFAELSNVKTDRNLLASLFVEVARCLNQDVGPKAAGGASARLGVDLISPPR